MGTRQSVPSSAQYESDDLLGKARKVRQALANLQGQLQLGGDEAAFIARVSHELRTPLHAMLALLELLLDERVGPLSAEQRKYLEVIDRNGQGLLRLADDVLNRSLMAAGALSMDVRATDVRDAVRAVAVRLAPLAEAKKLNLIVDLPSGLPAARCDGHRLEQVLTNLVGNAIKFTEAGSVSMTADADGTSVNIHVTDTGIGIPGSVRDRIFDDFFQAHPQHHREGTGLGLAIARTMTQQMGGRISVDSAHGEGSRFTISLQNHEEGAHGTREEGARGTHTPG
jgi:signal transduction histidine kinase